MMLVLLCSQPLIAQQKVSKKIEKSFSLGNSGVLSLENKYGDITINGWDQDKVSLTMTVDVTHKKIENAESLLKRISPIIKEMDNYLSVRTEIAEKNTGFFAKYFDKANPFNFDKSNLKISYTLNVPLHAELKITNTFGDLVLDGWYGELKASVQHGDIWINKDLNSTDIDLKFGKLRAKSIVYGNLRLKNGSLDMKTCKDLRITSDGSDIDIEKAASLELYSNKDRVDLKEIGTLNGELRFTNLQIHTLLEQVDLKMKLSDFKVHHIQNEDAQLIINQESSEISLNIIGLSFDFDAVLEEGLLRLPKSFDNVASEMIDKGKRIRKINASYGTSRSGKISVKGKKGVVLLKEVK